MATTVKGAGRHSGSNHPSDQKEQTAMVGNRMWEKGEEKHDKWNCNKSIAIRINFQTITRTTETPKRQYNRDIIDQAEGERNNLRNLYQIPNNLPLSPKLLSSPDTRQ